MDARWIVMGTVMLLAPGALQASGTHVFAGRGVVESLDAQSQMIVIRHEAISNYMAAMTMPFHVKDTNELAAMQRGEGITFLLHVTDTESWVDQMRDDGTRRTPPVDTEKPVPSASALMECELTNEMGRAVQLGDFRGQALAVTFFYTHCPLPDFCPRLSKNFQEASEKLATMTNAPVNWHFFSVSFDPQSDTAETLRAYAERYSYDSARWSFLTGAPGQIAALAHAVGVKYKENSGTIDHNFRTIIIDAAGRIQMVFPTGGNLSDQIVDQMLKAAIVTSKSLAQNQTP
jgi:protein SCO1/2